MKIQDPMRLTSNKREKREAVKQWKQKNDHRKTASLLETERRIEMTRYYMAKNMDRADITWTRDGWVLNCRNLFTGVWFTEIYMTEDMAIAGLKATGRQWREIV